MIDPSIGLCGLCIYHSLIRNSKGVQYHLCAYSKKNEIFPKYPKLPILNCPAFHSANEGKNIPA